MTTQLGMVTEWPFLQGSSDQRDNPRTGWAEQAALLGGMKVES